MLKTIDVLIGMSVVMLLVSLIVTVLTQFITSIFNTRGRHLLQGIMDLLQQIQPGLDREVAKKISAAVLTHPMIRDVGQRYGTVVQRDELTKILLELAAGDGPMSLERTAKEKLLQALKNNGVEQPGAVVKNVRDMVIRLELSRPELATDVRNRIALLEEAGSPFVAKVNSWFDQTMDRVSERFTFTTRGVTFAMGLMVALVIQFDTPLMVNRLATDPQLRASMLQEAVKIDQQQHAWDNMPPGQRHDAFQKLAGASLVTIPENLGEWQRNWSGPAEHPTILGVLLSAVLLSFGAPFWYNALKNLLRLRSLIAQKDDDQRAIRQSTQEPAAVSAQTAAPAAALGERGNLAAVG